MRSSLVNAVPSPFRRHLWIQPTFQHLYHVLAEYWQELPGMKGATGGNEEISTVRMRANNEVLIRGDGIPAY